MCNCNIVKFSTCRIYPTGYSTKSSTQNELSNGLTSSFVVIGIVVAIFFYFLKQEIFKKSQLELVEEQTELELAASSSPLRRDRGIQLNNVQFEDEHEVWLNYVSPSMIRQQQRMMEEMTASRLARSNQVYLEPIHEAHPRLFEDLPPTYEVPPTYEECTLKPD